MKLPLINLPQVAGRKWREEAEQLVSALVLGIDTMTSAAVAASDVYGGATCVFFQAAAPPGWKLEAAFMDKVIRVVSGAGGGTGGNWTLSGLVTKGTAVGLGQIPPHAHTASAAGQTHGHGPLSSPQEASHVHPTTTGTQAAHSHTGILKTAGDHSHTLYGYSGSGGGYPRVLGLNLNQTDGASWTAGAGNHNHASISPSSASHSHTATVADDATEHTHGANLAASGAHAHEISLGSAGADEPHSHTVTGDGLWRPAYVDVIVCSRL
jgi:hypothetical protein